jgi:hypothetical protein
MGNLIPSLIRTYVPIVIGALISWLITLGVEIDDSVQAGLVTALTGLLIAVYYTLIRLLEKKWPALSILLGSSQIPAQYTSDGAAIITTLPDPQEPPAPGGSQPPAGGMIEP